MTTDARSRAIVCSLIDLGHRFGLEVVAEGIEDAATWAALAAVGCDTAQGYGISRPLSADALTGWIRQRLPERAIA